ncbi:hypothetical protein CsSME_00033641 [Camellia sinensis var. sinensis]
MLAQTQMAAATNAVFFERIKQLLTVCLSRFHLKFGESNIFLFLSLSLRKTHHLFFNPLPLSTQGHAHLCPLFNPFLPLFALHSQIPTPSLVFQIIILCFIFSF